jgi:parallel beta-helix repeat protein
VNSRAGIYLSNTVNSTISGNTTDHNYNDGIRLKSNSNYNTVSSNISFGNAVTDASQATGINFLGSSYNTVVHNITYANEDSGLNFYDGSSYNQVIGNLTYGNGDHGIDNNGSPYNTVVGNTVHGNVTAGINFEESTEFGTNSSGAVISSNVCVDNGYLKLVGGGTLTGSNPGNIRIDTASWTGTSLDYDMVHNTTPGLVQIIFNGTPYYSMAEFKANNPSQEVNGSEANPLFKSPAPIGQRPAGAPYNVAVNLGDYHILATSPAIDSGNSSAPNPSTDLDGNPRVDVLTIANTGGGTYAYYDRGAYEYQPAAAQTITITSTAPSAAIFGGPTYTPTATATSDLPVAITVDAAASTVCSITGGVVSFIGVGSCVLDFNQAGNLLWSPAPQVQQTFAVGKANQTITVTTPAPASAAYNASFTVAATASSSLPVNYSATDVCTNLLGVFTMTSGTGTCTVHYNQAGDSNYNAAPEITAVVTATKIAQTISVGTHAPASAGYTSSFTVAATSSSTLAVTYSATGVCTNVLGVFTMTSNTGTCTVHYNQAGDANHNAALEVTEPVTATTGTQIITVTTAAPASAIYRTSFTVAATASSGLPVAYSATGACTNLQGVFTMTSGTGTCTVHYNQAGDANYAAAPEVTGAVTAAKAAQTITFTAPASPATYNTSFTIAPTSDSLLPVTVTPSGTCSILGTTVTMTSGTGICTLTASQSGDENYAPAVNVVQTVAAQKAAQAISIITHVPPSAAYLSEFTVSAISNSGLPVAYSATGVCTNIGATFTMTSAAGTCTVHFNQTGDANYTAATEVTEEVTARALAQTITVTTHAPGTAVFLTSFTVAATSSSGLPVTYSATGACTNVAGVFTMTSNFGICYVHYNQFGNSSYAAAPEIIEQVEQGTLFMYLPFIIR